MADYDVIERCIPNELRTATRAALGGAAIERIVDEAARGLARLVSKAFECPALEDLEKALNTLLEETDTSADPAGAASRSAAYLRFLDAVAGVKSKWICLPCAPIAALAAERAAVDLLAARVSSGHPLVRSLLERRYVEALADNQWLSRVALRLASATGLTAERYVGWREDVLRRIGNRARQIFQLDGANLAPIARPQDSLAKPFVVLPGGAS